MMFSYINPIPALRAHFLQLHSARVGCRRRIWIRDDDNRFETLAWQRLWNKNKCSQNICSAIVTAVTWTTTCSTTVCNFSVCQLGWTRERRKRRVKKPTEVFVYNIVIFLPQRRSLRLKKAFAIVLRCSKPSFSWNIFVNSSHMQNNRSHWTQQGGPLVSKLQSRTQIHNPQGSNTLLCNPQL